MKKVRKAVIPAAGFGTRFLPQTKAMPKEMLPIVDKPVIQYVVEEAVEAGIEDIIIVTGSQKRNIEDHFDRPSTDLVENLRMGGDKKRPLLEEAERIGNMANFIYVRQKGPYGNGTPLMNVRHIVGDEPFLYTWSDDFIKASPKSRFTQLIETYQHYGASVLAGLRAKTDADYNRYGFASGPEITPGIIDADTIIEKPGKENAPSDMATVSGFVFTPDIFDYLDKAKEGLAEDQELYYNDALKLMLADGKKVFVKEIENGKYFDCGDKLSWIKANVELALEREEFTDSLRDYLKSF